MSLTYAQIMIACNPDDKETIINIYYKKELFGCRRVQEITSLKTALSCVKFGGLGGWMIFVPRSHDVRRNEGKVHWGWESLTPTMLRVPH